MSIGQTAEVLDVDETGEQLTARFGFMKMVLPFTDIESLDGKRFEKEKSPKTEVKQKAPKAQNNNKATKTTARIRVEKKYCGYSGAKSPLS